MGRNIAGSTYCAVASMELMGVLDKLSAARREGLLEWCINRQVCLHGSASPLVCCKNIVSPNTRGSVVYIRHLFLSVVPPCGNWELGVVDLRRCSLFCTGCWIMRRARNSLANTFGGDLVSARTVSNQIQCTPQQWHTTQSNIGVSSICLVLQPN